MELLIAILGLVAAVIGRNSYVHIVQNSKASNLSIFTTVKSVCSLVIPGLGQFLDGQFKKGLGHFIFAAAFWIALLMLILNINGSGFLLLPGILPHIFSSGEATRSK